MEDLSRITETIRLPVHIEIPPYLADHHVEGRVVLPAVEAMHLLAETVKHFQPKTDITVMNTVRFDKFLYIQPGETRLNAYVDISLHENGDIAADLITKNRSKKSLITRIKSHASICYPKKKIDFEQRPPDLSSARAGVCFEISPDKIYRELVRFGPAYHNIRDTLYISKYGAFTQAGSPGSVTVSDQSALLGSPFPLDAAFHAASVWGQRYGHKVAFPVGITRLRVFNPTRFDAIYFIHILPLDIDSTRFLFDIRIYDKSWNLFEVAGGVQMRDVSAGRIKPPAWITKTDVPGVTSKKNA
ncbi:MAG: polyketide synthase dehydratase domain-containing protein [Desulfobacterales bacterium]